MFHFHNCFISVSHLIIGTRCTVGQLLIKNQAYSSYLKGPMFRAINKTTANTQVDFLMVLVSSGFLLLNKVFCARKRLWKSEHLLFWLIFWPLCKNDKKKLLIDLMNLKSEWLQEANTEQLHTNWKKKKREIGKTIQ